MIRQIRTEDFDRLIGCWNDSAPFDPVSAGLFYEKVAEDSGYRSQFGLLDQEDGLVLGFVVGVVRSGGTKAGGKVAEGFLKFLAVRSEYRGSGIGSSLLDEIESALVKSGVDRIRLGESAPNYLTPGVDVRYAQAIRFFERHGYRVIGETYNLDVSLHYELGSVQFDTNAENADLIARGFQIRRAGRRDEDAVYALLAEHWPSWSDEVARTFRNVPISLHIAVRSGSVVAFSAYDGNNIGTGWFGPMGTDPAFRGLGLGSVLLKRCLSDISDQGHRRAIIPWVEPVGFYYRAAGATIARIFVRMEKEKISV